MPRVEQRSDGREGRRWVCLAGGTAMILCAGAVYGFGSIAQEMRRHLQLSAYQQGLLALCGNVGLWVGSFTGGIIADFRGPRMAMLGGATFFLVGYGGIWLLLRSGATTSAGRHVAHLVSALWLCAGLGSGWVYNATIFTNSANFGLVARPKVIGLLATLFGASSTIWSTILNGCIGGEPHRSRPAATASYAHGLTARQPAADDLVEELLLPAVDDGSASGGEGVAGAGTFTCVGGWVNGGLVSYFFLLAVALPSLTVLGAFSSFRITDASERSRADRADGENTISRRLNASSVGVLLVLLAVGLSSVLDVAADGDATAVWVRMIAPIVVLVLFGIVVIGIALLGLRHQPAAATGLGSPSAPLLAGFTGDQQGTRSYTDRHHGDRNSKDVVHTPQSALCAAEFWLMWLVMTTVCGSNASTMNILSLIFTDRHAGSEVVSRIASILVMVISSLSRFMCGNLIAASPLRPTPAVLVAGAATMATAAQVLFTLDSEVFLFGACVSMGMSDGMFWGSLPVVSNRVFGLRNSGGIYGMLVCFGAVGFITLSLGVQPAVYASHLKHQVSRNGTNDSGAADGNNDRVCQQGVLCFRGYHITCACFAAVGLASSLGLLWTIAWRRRLQEQQSKRNDGLL
jgi:hypothetical protein